jgi:hypothetical protein
LVRNRINRGASQFAVSRSTPPVDANRREQPSRRLAFLGFLAAGRLSASHCETARLAPTCTAAAVPGPKVSPRPLRVGEFSPHRLTASRGPCATLQRSFWQEWHKKREFDSEAGRTSTGRRGRNLLFHCHLCMRDSRDAEDAWTARFSVVSPVFVISSLFVDCCVVSP